jgi:membrane protein DedA with SNARE-associated domain
LGAGIWTAVLIALGYFIGGNETLIQENLPLATGALVLFVVLILAVYVLWQRSQPTR